MYIILAGAGLIGSQITKLLVSKKYDVVVIDIDRSVCENIYRQTGAMTIHGSATDIQVLKEAGAEKADMLLCFLRNDADNISCSLLAKSLGIPKIIACARKPFYEDAYLLSGVTKIVRMTELLLNRIMNEVEEPAVKKLLELGNGAAELYVVKIPKKSKAIGMKVRTIAENKKFPENSIFIGSFKENSDKFAIPWGDHVFEENEMVFIVAKREFIKQATEFLIKK